MTPHVEKAYQLWMRAVDRGYGSTTTRKAMIRIDRNISRLKAQFERLNEADKADAHQWAVAMGLSEK